ncbi:hypothetical protein PVK06_026359 [Gossypium arboreum]|uniref:Uncharacterized protein n=1 Tax=Gossypium arboreum TaxID=29729 RepID=A0ABR0NXG7_GOSAR|nr:hypothetical protein PVK06_026359 [Gossypium arboreum]
MGLHLEGKAGTIQVASAVDGHSRNEVEVEVGSLDHGKHSVVVFHDRKNPNNIAPPLNNNMGLPTMDISGSGKGLNNRVRGISKKRNKIFHGNNTHFKITGSQRMPLKESMEQITESLSALSNTNFDSVLTNKLDGQNKGGNLPGQ